MGFFDFLGELGNQVGKVNIFDPSTFGNINIGNAIDKGFSNDPVVRTVGNIQDQIGRVNPLDPSTFGNINIGDAIRSGVQPQLDDFRNFIGSQGAVGKEFSELDPFDILGTLPNLNLGEAILTDLSNTGLFGLRQTNPSEDVADRLFGDEGFQSSRESGLSRILNLAGGKEGLANDPELQNLFNLINDPNLDPNTLPALLDEIGKLEVTDEQNRNISQGIGGLEDFVTNLYDTADSLQLDPKQFIQAIKDSQSVNLEGQVQGLNQAVSGRSAGNVLAGEEAKLRRANAADTGLLVSNKELDVNKFYAGVNQAFQRLVLPAEQLIAQFKAGRPVDFASFLNAQDISTQFAGADIARSDQEAVSKQASIQQIIDNILNVIGLGTDAALGFGNLGLNAASLFQNGSGGGGGGSSSSGAGNAFLTGFAGQEGSETASALEDIGTGILLAA